MAIAFMMALDALDMNSSMRRIADLAAALQLSEATYTPGKIGMSYQKIFKPGSPTLQGRADALRIKYRKAIANPATVQWLMAMAGIFMMIIGAKDWGRVRRESLFRAAVIGEQEFVEALLRRLRN
jgi:hypothetical protein